MWGSAQHAVHHAQSSSMRLTLHWASSDQCRYVVHRHTGAKCKQPEQTILELMIIGVHHQHNMREHVMETGAAVAPLLESHNSTYMHEARAHNQMPPRPTHVHLHY